MAKYAFLFDTQILTTWGESIVKVKEIANTIDCGVAGVYAKELMRSEEAFGGVVSSLGELNAETEVLFLVIHPCGCTQDARKNWVACRKELESKGFRGIVVLIINEGDHMHGDVGGAFWYDWGDLCHQAKENPDMLPEILHLIASGRAALVAHREEHRAYREGRGQDHPDWHLEEIRIEDLWQYGPETHAVESEYQKRKAVLEGALKELKDEHAKRLATLKASFETTHPKLK